MLIFSTADNSQYFLKKEQNFHLSKKEEVENIINFIGFNKFLHEQLLIEIARS